MTPEQRIAVSESVDRVQQAIRGVAARKRNVLLAEQEVDRAEIKLAQARDALTILLEEINFDRPPGISYETALAMFQASERRSHPNTPGAAGQTPQGCN